MNPDALVFAGGVLSKRALNQVELSDELDIWCADGGVVHALGAGLTPDVIVGDCDSTPKSTLENAISQGARVIQHPPKKNASDLELTLRELVSAGYQTVTLLAVSGGRTDHALFNWMLALQQDWPFQLTLVDDTISAQLVHASVGFDLSLQSNQTVSLFCRDSVSGVTTSGLAYPLVDARLMGGSTLGLSNEVLESEGGSNMRVQVSVSSGRLLVCVVHPLQSE